MSEEWINSTPAPKSNINLTPFEPHSSSFLDRSVTITALVDFRFVHIVLLHEQFLSLGLSVSFFDETLSRNRYVHEYNAELFGCKYSLAEAIDIDCIRSAAVSHKVDFP